MKKAAKGLLGTLVNHTDIKNVLQNEIENEGILNLYTLGGNKAIREVDLQTTKRLPIEMQNQLSSLASTSMDTCILRTFKLTNLPVCCQDFFIRIPGLLPLAGGQDESKPIIVFPILQLIGLTPQEQTFGYFMDPTNNTIDSVVYTDYQDMSEDFFAWFVGHVPDCDAQWKQPGCDNDGICEFQFGETEENCPDCQNLSKNLPGKGKLYLKSITSSTDWNRKNNPAYVPDKAYQEWHYNGKYEIGFQFAIYNTQRSKVEYQFVIDDTDPQEPYKHNHDIIAEFSSWGDCEVPRCKEKIIGSGTKCNNGSITTRDFQQTKLLSSNFHPLIDEVYFLLYEKDWEFANPENVGYDFGVYINRGVGKVRRPYSHNYSAPGGSPEWNAVHGAVSGSSTTHPGVSLIADAAADIAYIDNDPSLWTPIAPIGGKQAWEYNSGLDSEWGIQFIYIED